jgi:hypothetical protein
MPSAAEIYTTELSRELRYLAMWTPGVPVQLGAIGSIANDHVFTPLSSIESFGIKYEDSTSHGETSLSFTSQGSVDVRFKAAGQTSDLVPSVPTAQAGIGVSFKREFATVFRADALTHHQIADQLHLAREILSLVRAGEWDRNWVFVTHVVEADSTTALVSNTRDAAVEFALGAGVASGGLDLLQAEFKPRVAATRDMAVTMVASGGLTPLFRASRVKRRWFVGSPQVRAAYAGDVEQFLDDSKSLREELEKLEENPEDLENEFLDDIPVYDNL